MAESEQLGLEFTVPQRKIYPVSELLASVRTHVERSFTDTYVEGEVSNWRPAASGHLYFTLKDNSAQLRVVMWRSQAKLLRFNPENGMQVIARGRVTVYDERGDLQLQAEYLEPKGAGALQAAFEQLKAKLAAEGLFSPDRKKPIPALPKRIGVVTSPRGAAIQDMLNILRRRHETVGVLIYPAQVQGETAASEVSAGLRFFNREKNVDVIVVARGGGSFEDLFAFNNEGLARTVAASTIPVISAVGHETDFTICDFVADRRAATPSEAAEIVIHSKQELGDRLLGFGRRMEQAMRFKLLRARNELSAQAQRPGLARMQDSILRRQQRIDELVYRMAQAQARSLKQISRRMETLDSRLRHQDLRVRLANVRRELDARDSDLRSAIGMLLTRQRNRLDSATTTLQRTAETVLLRHRTRWSALDGNLRTLSPTAILSRGYALVFDSEGRLVKDSTALKTGDSVRTRLGNGEFTSDVTGVKP